MSDKPVGHYVEFEIDRPIASSKNSRRIYSRGKRKGNKKVKSLPSEQCEKDIKALRLAAREAIEWGEMPFDRDDILQLDTEYCPIETRTWVCVTKVGEIPKRGRRYTERDVHSSVETICDALEDVIYPDDRNFVSGSYKRVVPQEWLED